MSKWKVLVFLSIPVIILALGLYRKVHPSHYSDFTKVRSIAIFADWENLKFEKIEQTPSFLEKVQSIPEFTNSPLSEVQNSNLFRSIFNALNGLNSGTYEAYRQFRTPTPARLNPLIFNEADRDDLNKGIKSLLHPGESPPEDFQDYVKLVISRINNGRGLTNYLIAACLTNASIYVEERTNLPPNLLATAAKGEKVGLSRPAQFFIPDRGATNILSEDGKLLCAVVSLVVSHTDPDPPYRIYIRYIWDNKFTCWVPVEYVQADAKRQKWSLLW